MQTSKHEHAADMFESRTHDLEIERCRCGAVRTCVRVSASAWRDGSWSVDVEAAIRGAIDAAEDDVELASAVVLASPSALPARPEREAYVQLLRARQLAECAESSHHDVAAQLRRDAEACEREAEWLRVAGFGPGAQS